MVFGYVVMLIVLYITLVWLIVLYITCVYYTCRDFSFLSFGYLNIIGTASDEVVGVSPLGTLLAYDSDFSNFSMYHIVIVDTRLIKYLNHVP